MTRRENNTLHNGNHVEGPSVLSLNAVFKVQLQTPPFQKVADGLCNRYGRTYAKKRHEGASTKGKI